MPELPPEQARRIMENARQPSEAMTAQEWADWNAAQLAPLCENTPNIDDLHAIVRRLDRILCNRKTSDIIWHGALAIALCEFRPFIPEEPTPCPT